MKYKYIVLGVLLAAYTIFINYYFVPVTGGTDSNGYHVCAKMIASQGQFHQKPVDDFQFIGNMWVVNDRNEFYPKYPPLYPALAAGAMTLFGDQAGFYLCPVLAVLAVFGMFFLCRFFMPEKLAVAGSFLLATSPVFNHFALSKVSHGPSMGFLIWGLVCFFAAVSRRRLKSGIIYAVLSGLLLGYAEGIRYTNIIMLIPPLVYGLLFLRKKRIWILGAFAGAVAVPYLFLCWFHWTSFGSPFATGYSLTNEQSGFALAYFWTNLRLYIPAVISDGTGLVTCLALIELVLLSGRNKRKAAVFLSWIIPLSLLYMFYYWAPTASPSSFLRFILPVFVPMYILALSGLWNLIREYSGAKQLFIILMLVIIHGIWGVCASFEDSEKYYIQQNSNKKVVDFALEKIPEGTVVFTDYGNLNTLDFEKKWVLYPLSILNQNLLKRRMQRSLENSIAGLQKQRAELLKKRLLDLSPRDFHKTVMEFVANHLKHGRRVYVLSSAGGINTFMTRYKRYMETSQTAEAKEEVPFYRFYPTTRSSSRVDKAPKKKKVVVKELIQITAVRKKPLTMTESIKDLQTERSQIIKQLREEDEAVMSDVYRLETISRQIYSLQRTLKAREDRKKRKK